MVLLAASTFSARVNIFGNTQTYIAYSLFYIVNILMSLIILATCINLSVTKSEQLAKAEPYTNYMKKCLIDKVEGFEVQKEAFNIAPGSVAVTILFEVLMQIGMAISLCAFMNALSLSKWTVDEDDSYYSADREDKEAEPFDTA